MVLGLNCVIKDSCEDVLKEKSRNVVKFRDVGKKKKFLCILLLWRPQGGVNVHRTNQCRLLITHCMSCLLDSQ